MESSELIPGVYLLEVDGKKRIATRPCAPGSVYGERFVGDFRLWDPTRSKLAALLLKYSSKSGGVGLDLGLSSGSKVLYLGAATGTTVSHVSDIVPDGLVYAVEFSPRSMRDLLRLCESRRNIIPVLADAALPESYSSLVEMVDMVYQDVAQRNQAEIATRNAQRYLRPGGTLMLMMKTRSIDVTLPPKEVYSSEIERLLDLQISEVMDLMPYHHDHWAVIAEKNQ